MQRADSLVNPSVLYRRPLSSIVESINVALGAAYDSEAKITWLIDSFSAKQEHKGNEAFLI